jgi:hypothetical protein
MGYELGRCYRTHLDYLPEHHLLELLEIWNSYLIRTIVYLTQGTIAGPRASHATIRGAPTLIHAMNYHSTSPMIEGKDTPFPI